MKLPGPLRPSAFLPAILALFSVDSAALRAGGLYTGQPSDRILGQPDYGTVASGNSAAFVVNPACVAVDPTSGKIFVSDTFNNRVLRFAADAGDGDDAEVVFGQNAFFESNPNQGQANPAANTLDTPTGIHVDAFGVLWIADTGNHRVLVFYNASSRTSGEPADMIYGQTSSSGKDFGNAANKFHGPAAVYSDAAYRLYVSDRQNRRVLRFDGTNVVVPPGPDASAVLGQSQLDSNVSNPAGQSNFVSPAGIHGDGEGRLWVVDDGANRVLRFDDAANKGNGAPADGVVGQPDFVSSSSATSDSAFNAPGWVLPLSGGDLLVSIPGEKRILLFPRAEALRNGGRASVVLGQDGFFSTDTGSAPNRTDGPQGMAVDPQGRLWVALEGTSRAVRFTPDQVRPRVSVRGKRIQNSSKGSATLRGAASDNGRLAAVEVKGRGPARSARGTAAWSHRAPLRPGRNPFTAVSVDAAGNRSLPARVIVTRSVRRR